MLQKAFGFHEAQTAWAFLRSARAGEGKKKDRKKKKNGMRGEGLGFPLRRHRHLLPVQPPPSLPGLPGYKTQNLLCVWVSMGCPRTPWGWYCTASLPLPPSPASCALELAAQMWPGSTAGAKPGVEQLGHICPRAGTGGGQPCSGSSMHPISSPVLVSGQTREGCVPREGLWVPRLHLPVVTKIPWDLICTTPSIPTAVGAGTRVPKGRGLVELSPPRGHSPTLANGRAGGEGN